MGCYVNPRTTTKEQWLNECGISTGAVPGPITTDTLPVCLVDNGMFNAAAVCYDSRELKAFTDPTDARFKEWYMVRIEELKTVSDIASYIKG